MDLHPKEELTWRLALFLGAMLVALMILLAFAMAAEAVPPRPEQPAADVFEAPGWPSPTLQSLSPVAQKAKSQRSVTYRLITLSGCSTGTVPADMLALEAELLNKTGFRLVRDDLSADFTYRINCGSGQIAICGSVNVYCLGRGFPTVSDVDVSDVISTYYPESRLAVLLHETMHALGVWGEQYCTGDATSGPCNGLSRFTPAPGWVDFMNTGPLSRHGFEAIELERWDRTVYPLPQAVPEWGETQTNGLDWWTYNNWGGEWHLTRWLADGRTEEYRSTGGPWSCVAGCP